MNDHFGGPMLGSRAGWVRLRAWARGWYRFARADRMGRTPRQRRHG